MVPTHYKLHVECLGLKIAFNVQRANVQPSTFNEERPAPAIIYVSIQRLRFVYWLERQAMIHSKTITRRQAREQVVLANRILSNEGIFDYLGHVSVRHPTNPESFLISRALAPDQVTQADILEVALTGKVLTKGGLTPYSERIIHGAIYKARQDVHSVVHAHPLAACIMANSGVQFRPVIHQAAIFFEGVPVYDEYDFTSPGATGFLVTTQAEGDRLAQMLGTKRALLMAGHGCVVVGDCIPSAVHAAITLRDNIFVQLGSEQAGQPKYITEAQSKVMIPLLAGGRERAWNYYVRRLKNADPAV
jgi:3-hydroxy-2-methylpyridine-4,5-dicarboxylate 4-decarboxylase